MNRFLFFVFAGLAVAGGAFVSGPTSAKQQLEAALIERDSASLDRLIDLPALRATLKDQINDATGRAVDSVDRSVWGGLTKLAGSAVTGLVVDQLVTPEFIAGAACGEGLTEALGMRDANAPPPCTDLFAETEDTWISPDRYESRLAGDATTVTFGFTREGFRTWRLTDLTFATAE